MTDIHAAIREADVPGVARPREHLPEIARTPHDALQMIQAAHQRSVAAKQFGLPSARVQADQRLQAAVDHARDLGVAWGTIGDTLGIARGNAYHRYRRRLARPDRLPQALARTRPAQVVPRRQ